MLFHLFSNALFKFKGKLLISVDIIGNLNVREKHISLLDKDLYIDESWMNFNLFKAKNVRKNLRQ